MKISCCWLYAISKYGYPPSIENVFKALKEMADMGFEYVELEGVREENLKEVHSNREKIKNYCNDLGVKIVNFCPIIPEIVSLDEKEREKAKNLFMLGIELAKYFDCETIQTDSYTPPLEFIGEAPYKESISYGKQYKVKIDPQFDWNRLWDVLVDSFRFASETAKSAGLKFCLEPRVGEIISNTDALLRLMDHVKSDNFGAVLDTGHQNAQKEILPLSVEKLGSKIFYLHVSDNDGKINEHLPLGKGNIDWEGIFLALKKHNYQGYVAIDIGNIPDIEKAYTDSKQFLEDLSQKLGI
ncbi:MAG: sugar phosphate isomerase/epimerase [bacterium]|nr:sugar phosphate isomerase/epimerase [bacterium]